MGFANVTVNDCLRIDDFKVLQGEKSGLFVGMPSKATQGRDGKTAYYDTCGPLQRSFGRRDGGRGDGLYRGDGEVTEPGGQPRQALHLPAARGGNEAGGKGERGASAPAKASRRGLNADFGPSGPEVEREAK